MSQSRAPLRLLMHAAIDGELDAASVVDLERQFAADPMLAAEYNNLVTLKTSMRDKLQAHRASDALRAKVAALAASPQGNVIPLTRASAPNAFWSSKAWLSYAATALIAAGLASSATFMTFGPGRPPVGDQVVAAHMRGLIAATPVDVVSSDRHTVKPWFDTRLARSPQVVDLAAQGYELVGGRADVIAGAPAPTFVYRQRGHLISVTAIAADAKDSSPVSGTSISGYRAVAWREGDFTYWAASDIERADLDGFVAAFRKAAEATR